MLQISQADMYVNLHNVEHISGKDDIGTDAQVTLEIAETTTLSDLRQ